MIDLINKISYTGFYAWLIAAVHPLIMVAAVSILTLGSTFWYARRLQSMRDGGSVDAHMFLAVVFPIWTIAAGWVTSNCFRVHGVNDGEPLIAVSAVGWFLYFLAGCMGIAFGFKEESE